MSNKPQQTAYTFATARVRSLELGVVGKDRIAHLADAASVDELYARLEEYGVTLVRDESGCVQVEPTLGGILKRALVDVLESAPAPELYDFLRYTYDCHNIKSAIKCYVRGLPADDMLIDLGTVPPAQVAKMPEEDDYSALPAKMAAVAPLALQAYKKTGDPRAIDLALDKACFADMLSQAQKGGEPFHVELVCAQIDLANIMTCLRLIRMQAGEQGGMLLEQALLDGGTLDTQALMRVYGEGESALLYMLKGTAYERLSKAISESGGSASGAEKAADDWRMELVRKAKQVTFGAPVLSAYFLAQEYAVRNIRIVIAAKKAGLAPEIIHERIRTSYV